MTVVPDKIIRSDRKTLTICIDAYNRLIVRAPKKCGDERIFAFIKAKENWILQKRAEREKTGISFPTDDLQGYEFLLLGRPCKIHITQEKRVRFDGENYILYLPDKAPKKRVVQWLKENAKRIFTQVANEQALRMQTEFSSLAVNSAKGRWGSCSYQNALHFSFRLLYAPKEIVCYVVVHELAHTKYKNHSPLFWKEVERYIPDWKEKRRWLKIHGALMEIF